MSKDKRRSQSGFISVELMVAVSLSFVFLVFIFNMIVIEYGRGVVRAAADEGARAGSRVSLSTTADNTQEACVTKANQMIASLGAMAVDPEVDCTINADTQRVNTIVTATFEPWMPWIPTVHAKATASSVKEQAPQ